MVRLEAVCTNAAGSASYFPIKTVRINKVTLMPKNSSPKSPSQRQLRVGEEIRHVLAGALMRGECHDPEISSTPVTISEVRISPDLKNATAYFMPLGGVRREETLAALTRNAAFFRKLVSEHMKLRYTPRVFFRLDTSFDEAHRIDLLLKSPKVARDLEGEC
jgi:ribosome-binding factor A